MGALAALPLLAGLLAGAPGAGAQSHPVQARAGRPAVAATTAPPVHGGAVVLDQVTVIDVEHGRRLHDQRVVIVGNRIRALGSRPRIPVPAGARVVHARGQYLIPGLWDMHTHPTVLAPTAEATAHQVNAVYRQLVASGITGIRDAASALPLDTFRVWKQEIAAGRRVGPRMIVSGPSIEGANADCTRARAPRPPCDPYHVYISRPEEAGRVVDSLKAAGADMIKIHAVPRPIWFAVAAAARRANIPFGGHFERGLDDGLPPTVDGLVASDSGALILDHELWADVCGQDNDTLASLAMCDAAAERLRRNHTWIVDGIRGARVFPLERRARRYGNAEETPADSTKAWRPPSAAERRQLPTGADFAAAVPDSERQGRICRPALLAYAAGLPWMPGPDFPIDPVTAAHVQLLSTVLCGVPPLWTLRAATLEPARALGLSDSLGTVAAGKVADLVLLEGDPLEDIWNVTKIAGVFANGHYFDRAALDRLLTEAGEEWFRVRALEAEYEKRAALRTP